eukprot:TRINITY_DN7307_c0_g1_i1.p1 TRINITY_DN7307_c0_g1~~TRINITY_DN7307_c0_g1_i1.p1  ORF type:complete len:185 (-),score=13.46 TRINITY_DN7307_c0_g1_i1:44-598(-)
MLLNYASLLLHILAIGSMIADNKSVFVPAIKDVIPGFFGLTVQGILTYYLIMLDPLCSPDGSANLPDECGSMSHSGTKILYLLFSFLEFVATFTSSVEELATYANFAVAIIAYAGAGIAKFLCICGYPICILLFIGISGLVYFAEDLNDQRTVDYCDASFALLGMKGLVSLVSIIASAFFIRGE